MGFSTLDDFLARARLRLDAIEGPERLAEGGDIEFLSADQITNIRRAAVLIPVIKRSDGPRVLLTHRPNTMPTHAGQVAFPGGKVDPEDADEIEAALREAHEEVGLPPEAVQLVGRSAPYLTGTAFRIVPVLGVIGGGFDPVPDPTEVDSVFEAPLSFLMNPENHLRQETMWKGQLRRYYEMPWQGHRIWGVTAGIIRALHSRLYGDEEE